ncbi:MAG TPA: dihydrofolate reductase [Cyclobacteriaceae bacterium]|nr:dihydrofolate reductase [Cyclobacteriaceae bacterium]
MIVSLIAALTKNMVIGKNNDLPWKLPDDMKYFMETTKDHAVIMGRKNYDSLPPKFKPLKDRMNIVMSKHRKIEGVTTVDSLEEALRQAATYKNKKEVFVIGGAQIYEQALPIANKLYLTEIDAVIEGDTFFPAFDKKLYHKDVRKHHPKDDRHAYAFDFVVYERF